jgi:hypothetical protein
MPVNVLKINEATQYSLIFEPVDGSLSRGEVDSCKITNKQKEKHNLLPC